jgi:DNA (cytosine-5)-methyltransferase 1
MVTNARTKRNKCLRKRIPNGLPAIELFSGAGLFGDAFEREGFQVLQAVECDPIAAATHAANFRGRIDVTDVRRTTADGKCDVLISAPPCQGFSTLGRRDENDPRNSLCFEIVRWAKEASPSVIVVENVVAFLDSPKWKRLCRRLRKLGYEVGAWVLNAADFGVAQLRLRSFTVATRIGFPEITAARTNCRLTVRDCLSDLPRTPDGKNYHYCPMPSDLALARMRLIPPGGDKRDVMAKAPHLTPPSWWKTQREVTDVWGRMEWEAPCNTLRTEFLNPSKGRYIHPEENRVVSLREGARLHSIDDEWRFCGTPYQIARQIGNSVPPLLGRAVAKSIRKLFRS